MCSRELSTEAAHAPSPVLGSPAPATLSLAPLHYTLLHDPYVTYQTSGTFSFLKHNKRS